MAGNFLSGLRSCIGICVTLNSTGTQKQKHRDTKRKGEREKEIERNRQTVCERERKRERRSGPTSPPRPQGGFPSIQNSDHPVKIPGFPLMTSFHSSIPQHTQTHTHTHLRAQNSAWILQRTLLMTRNEKGALGGSELVHSERNANRGSGLEVPFRV